MAPIRLGHWPVEPPDVTIAVLHPHLRTTMRIRLLPMILALGAIVTAAAPARPFDLSKMLGNPDQDEALDTFKLIHVSDLAASIANPKSGVQIYDANHPDTRAQYGIIPGAHLLPSADGFSVAQELPADKNAKLVFYCANTH
jgi:hypothetical protein